MSGYTIVNLKEVEDQAPNFGLAPDFEARFARVALEAELVGLIPQASLAGYPEDVPIRGFDPDRHVIERRLAALND